MPDYQEMYRKLFRATEDAINTLIAAQQACEDLYIKDTPPELHIFSAKTKEPENG